MREISGDGFIPLEDDHAKINHRYAKRLALICSSVVALASGTPYLYGVYSPQLINRCGFSAIDSSYLSFMGNIGSSIGGFFAGLIIDRFGVLTGILLGALLEFSGFSIMYYNYKYALHNFPHLLLAMVCIGFGSVLAYFATIKVATLNFPNHRGLANACPVSAYGLAALFYAFISTVWFNDNIEGLLKFIALFSGITITLCSLFIRIYEHDDNDDNDIEDDDDEFNRHHGGHPQGHNLALDDESDISSDENEFELGLQYLLKGHRGSFAQLNNFTQNDSSASLFSDVSDLSSIMTSSSSFRASSVVSIKNPSTSASASASQTQIAGSAPKQKNNPISINHSKLLRSNSNTSGNINPSFSNSYLSSSPLDFKAKQQSFIRSGSFRMPSSMNNSPRASRWFGSVTQKPSKDMPTGLKMTANEDVMSSSINHSIPNSTNNNEALLDIPGTSSLASSPNNSVNTAQLNGSNSNMATNMGSPKSSLELKNSIRSGTNLPMLNNSIMSAENNNVLVNEYDNSTKSNSSSNLAGTNFTLSNQELADLINKSKSNQKVKKKRKRKLTSKQHVIKLLKNKLFLSHYFLNAIYCAIGQVYIFSIGFIVRAQVNYYRLHSPSLEDTTIMIRLANQLSQNSVPGNIAVTYQALQVSIISFSNFMGRLISGPVSDLIHKKWKKSKIYVVIFSLAFLTLGQMALLISNKLDFLSLTSFLIGLSYGSIYGAMPSIVADSFGASKFATTWALLGTGPITVFLILSDYFGTVYDKNSVWSNLGDQKLKMCLKGRYCYWDVFAVNSCGCVLLFIGYLWLVMSHGEKKGKLTNV